ncbi:MAG TPA: Ig-like domain-containing protein, partial [Verrucomicrobiae bacterium]|nr:Ig-like domain-containing protein [Verrucomicrobiae bacterium]
MSCFGTAAQQAGNQGEFRPGAVRTTGDLPLSRLRTQIERLPADAQARALAWLGNLHFPVDDLQALQVDPSGGIFYADEFKPEAAAGAANASEAGIAQAAVPVSPFPANLVFHSKPGAPNTIYLNFSGETVMNTAWNTSVGRASIPAVAFSVDADRTTFSDAEQLAIRRIWQRVSEDYAPFNVNVTTERPANFNNRTAHALITRNTDANGADNPAATAGGVAYVGVFGTATYAQYRPAWIYDNNLVGEESYIAEAVSHEIGHNLGLSHDGRTDGQDYYGGHGSGEISWGPIMGTGYGRNVSQWSKGEYYLSNNTQDDLATMAGKLSYRTDDHGNTLSSATALVIGGGGNITSTTPETDPANNSPANKGTVERNNDVDWFSFTSGAGTIELKANPWAVPSGITRGGNIDLLVQLYDSSGRLLATNNPASGTAAVIQTNVSEGVYYLTVRNSATGDPTTSSPSGYTAYGSIGQYFISGSVIPTSVVTPPGAELQVANVTQPGVGTLEAKVTYTDNAAVDVATIDSNDLWVSGPNGYSRPASLISVDSTSNRSPVVATYGIAPPGGAWTQQDQGTYTISIRANQVGDTEGAWAPAQELGQFTVNVPSTVYYQSMDSNPGWTFEGMWEYGPSRYAAGTGPTGGFTGNNFVGYNLGGNYQNGLLPVYATTPTIDCSGASTIALRFRRWLRLRNGDTANIQVSVNGITWIDVWSTSKTVADNSWQDVQYMLPAIVARNPSVRLRWGISSGVAQNDIGWNIDDVTLIGDGSLDTLPPSAILDAQNVVNGGSPVHTLNVRYVDNVAVKVASLGTGDLYVLGPNGYSNVVEFSGVDVPTDGTPRTASYAVAAPGGAWSSGANGDYQVYLQDAEVSDTASNSISGSLLGTFSVAISDSRQALVVEPVTFSVQEGSQGSFSVRLAQQPSATVVVTVQHAGGDADLLVVNGAPIVFSPNNWSTPISIVMAAAPDADQENGTATIECRSDGLAPVAVAVTEIDLTRANQPPNVVLTSPGEGAIFSNGDNITFSATASDDRAVSKVEFFANETLLGSDTGAPYSISATLASGTYSVTARATDDEGATATSEVIHLTVGGGSAIVSITRVSGAYEIRASGVSGTDY